MGVDLPIVGFTSALLVLIPLPLHWKAGNVSVLSAIFWLGACNIVYGINAAIWRDNVTVGYEIWCDFATRVRVGANIGLPASGMCICRRLAHVSSPYYKTPSSKDKSRWRRFEIGMCAILPIVAIALEVIVEANRFAVEEGFGCTTSLYHSTPVLFIDSFPPVLLSLAEMVYAGEWQVFLRALPNTQSTPASGPYLRLFVFAVAEMVFATVVSMFIMVQSVQMKADPWTSWEDAHKDWLEIPQIPRAFMPEFYWAYQTFAWYIPPLASVMFFGHFGFDNRVISQYKHWFAWITAHVLRVKSEKTPVLPLRIGNVMSAHGLAVDTTTTVFPSEEETVVAEANRPSGAPVLSSFPLVAPSQ